jgi:hypothetical protein
MCRYLWSMPGVDKVRELAERLHLDAGADPTVDTVSAAVRRKLLGLQKADLTTAEEADRLELTMALAELEPSPSKDVVPIPQDVMGRLLDIVETSVAQKPEPKADPTIEMRRVAKTSATKASSDFTKVRTLPLAGLGGVVAVLWGLTSAFDVDIPKLDATSFSIGALFILLVCAIGLTVAAYAQRRALQILRRLYDPRIQEDALGEMPDLFERSLYGEALSSFAFPQSRRAFGQYGYSGPHRRIPLLVRNLSTVDFLSAITDATELALSRLEDLRVIETVVVNRRQGYRFVEHSEGGSKEPRGADELRQ